jgi:hypothetical protein
MTRAQIALLPDGRRLHLQDGPIDLIVEGYGHPAAVQAAHAAAAARFATILDELCGELPLLRTAPVPARNALMGVVARRMHDAVAPFAAECFITPMAAVAGAVAEEVLGAMVAAAPLTRAYVNNGGDIALYLTSGTRFSIGMVDRPDRPALLGKAVIDAADPVRGIATSGRHGRSFSRGIAGIHRRPAIDLQPDSDLGNRLVTRHVEMLMPDEIAEALAAGLACAETLRDRGLIEAVALHLQGETVTIGLPARAAPFLFPPLVAARASAHG